MEIKKNLNKNIIYEEEYLLMWDIFVKEIVKEHRKNGYKRLLTNDQINFDMLELYKKIDILMPLSLKTYSLFDDELSARSEALNFLNSFNRIVNEFFSFALVDGYLNGNENNIVSGLYINNEYIKFLEIEIKSKNDKYLVVINYYHEIIDSIEFFFNEYKLINSQICIHKYGGIILESNDIQTKELKERLLNKFDIIFANSVEGTKNKYNYLENIGCIFIFEFRKNGKLRIKCPPLETYQDVKEEDIDDFIQINTLNLMKKINNLFFSISFNIVKNNKKTLCLECLKNQKNYLKIFNQRLNKKCDICNNEAIINILLLNL